MLTRKLLIRSVLPALATLGGLPLRAASVDDFKGYARGFTLTDHHGRRRQLSDFKGRVVVLFFGYTQCPDVCPTTLVELAQIKTALGPLGGRLQVLFVTVDPQRDTAPLLKAYMENFDPSFLALRGSPATLAEVAREFRVVYSRMEGPTPTSYTMNHSAGSFIYDAGGQLRIFSRYGSDPQVLQQWLKALLQE